ncbi:MAG: hypothetical protein US68_C0004G0005 [Candidatus Shapirobacteria bacterium GW2011_GWE1_38_10]|uniref:Uncharacterized protein n=1 Tax=Candidatus Shapirobacteria bacterium GW2011_GWE1_38_10 TaxID=1618488 RepID=A0A0G0I5A2_9BACT|nr:MAG: hypothetical protein US46_C0005G0021 [Candidatus Shapirobacteria bacterium GW2011_GWF2_37_20]KKQ50523.1 MAG: hypothetical protein US68_C0004G0005 [Candidatus Shapirobacteria bacterium GW2011_GWE1_38_10]KKQ64664.1 MAG: hypothetical protein US85_C0005G0012 [Candidatus Shapirobacteria bacterium GW2011_GWF1_38_23]HBP51603.1 hypothetical protein [Candidatus Shapirobacteria bacterium]
MTKKNKIILGLTILVVIVGVVAFWPKEEEINKIVDSPVVVPDRIITDYGSDTGAKEISLSEEQYSEVYLIKDLRDKVPINRTYFLIDFDYGVNKFIVKYKDTNKGVAEFEKWLVDTGYNVISKEYFQIK